MSRYPDVDPEIFACEERYAARWDRPAGSGGGWPVGPADAWSDPDDRDDVLPGGEWLPLEPDHRN